MPRTVGTELPGEVMLAFDARDLERKVGAAYVLITVDGDGTPRSSMLSAGEIYAPDARTVRLALWPGTRTGANIGSGGPILLCFVAPDTALYIRGRGRPWPSLVAGIEAFEIQVESVESDVHPGLPVTQGIRFRCEDARIDTLLADWARKLGGLKG